MMRLVLHLRVFVRPDRADATLRALRGMDHVGNIVHIPRVEVVHGEDLITAAVDPLVANDLVDRLRTLRIERPGAVVLVRQDHTEVMPIEDGNIGYWDTAADAIVIEEVVDEARENARLSATYLAYMIAAGIVAGVGVGQDQSVLIVGAMAISPDLLPLSAVCVGLVARARRTVAVGLSTLLAGLLVAAVAAGILVRLARLAGIVDPDLDLGDNVLTAFVTEPSATTVLVALAAGVAAMLSIERQAASAVGVAISVTTIPAAAAIGVAFGLGDWARMLDAAIVLGLNLVALAAAGSLTLWVQLHRGHSIAGRTMHGVLPPVDRSDRGPGDQRSTRPPTRQ